MFTSSFQFEVACAWVYFLGFMTISSMAVFMLIFVRQGNFRKQE